MANVTQKHLEGLTFRTAKEQKQGEDGKKKMVGVERPLMLDDLLSQRDTGDAFVVVTKDGKKYTIPKNKPKDDDGAAGAGK